QTGATHRCHGAGAVGLGDFRHHANGVGKVVLGRQHGGDTPARQAPVTHFAAAGKAHPSALPHRVGREDVVEHDVVLALSFQGIDDLGIAPGTQCAVDDGLGFTLV